MIMAKEEKITLDAEVTEALPDARFRVKLENGQTIVVGADGSEIEYEVRNVVQYGKFDLPVDDLFRETGDERHLPSPSVVKKYVKGEYGQKTGKGWYDYPDNS